MKQEQCMSGFDRIDPAPLPPDWLAMLTAATERRADASPSSPEKGPPILEGSRNTTLASLAGTMRAKGFDESAIAAALLAHNQNHCQPPLPDSEVRTIAASVAKYPAGKPDALGKHADAKATAPPAPFRPDEELDIRRIIRPELFLTAAVAGLGISVARIEEGIARARWMLYLQWKDGKREAVMLSPALPLPDGSQLIVHPIPANTAPSHQAPWSKASRARWLAGAQTPSHYDIFNRLCAIFSDYLDFPPAKASASAILLAVFTMLTYCYPVWDAVPYLYIGGPAGSGKSKIFDLLSRLVFRPLLSSNMTAPLLFRTLHDCGGTLLLDEAERLRESTPDVVEIRMILLAGYKRGGNAQRCKPETFEPQVFEVYGPKAVACISGLPAPLLSRCIPLYMFRCPPESQKPKRRLGDEAERFQQLRDDLHAWALGNAPLFIELASMAALCEGMTGRHYELWQPLLALAALVNQDRALRQFADEIIGDNQEDATPEADETLLKILTARILQGQEPQAKDILISARAESPELFARYSAKGVANTLKRYGLKTAKIHDKRVYRVGVDELRRVQDRYGIELNLPGQEVPNG
jgi:hypothetical protein